MTAVVSNDLAEEETSVFAEKLLFRQVRPILAKWASLDTTALFQREGEFYYPLAYYKVCDLKSEKNQFSVYSSSFNFGIVVCCYSTLL